MGPEQNTVTAPASLSCERNLTFQGEKWKAFPRDAKDKKVNAPIGRLYSAQQQTLDDRRRERRHPTHFEAIVTTSRGSRFSALLADVSLHGCCVQADAGALRQGAFVSIGLSEESMLPAIVRWVRGQAAGMEFLRAVPAGQSEWHELMDLGLDG